MKANWTRTLEDRYLVLKHAIAPLSFGEMEKAERTFEIAIELRKFPDALTEAEADSFSALNWEYQELLDSLPKYWADRYAFTTLPEEAKRAMVATFQSMHSQREQYYASEAIAATLRDQKFLAACASAGITPTRRQASKWNIGRRGAALRAAGLVR